MKLKFVDAEKFYDVYDFLTENEIEESKTFIEADFSFFDGEVLFSYHSGCMILRYYSDGVGYHFDAPFSISEIADMESAFAAISEYCKKEAIPEVVVGIEPELKNMMLRGAAHYIEREDDDGTFVIEIQTECMMEEYLPEMLVEDVYLGEFSSSYAEPYEEMLRNENLNLHFGYNILDDLPNGNGIDFIESVRKEFENGESMTFAATVLEEDKNVFVGEGCLYAFDGRGSAEVSFRVLPRYQRKKIGTKILKGLIEIARSLGLKRIIAEVKKENKASIALLDRVLGDKNEKIDKYQYVYDL